MVCRRGGFTIQRHHELRDLEAEMVKMVCNDVQIEPVIQEINGEVLTPGTNRAASGCPARDSSSWLLGAARLCLFRRFKGIRS